MYMVRGNCDICAAGNDELLLPLEGVTILMAHGHEYGVKTGLAAFAGRARQLGAALALFGHTHRAVIRESHGLCLMNPGQMERDGGGLAASYGLVTVGGGKFDCRIVGCREGADS